MKGFGICSTVQEVSKVVRLGPEGRWNGVIESTFSDAAIADHIDVISDIGVTQAISWATN